ncbi:MAG: hypothetical protein ABSA86_02400 [Oryzomonas sp.]
MLSLGELDGSSLCGLGLSMLIDTLFSNVLPSAGRIFACHALRHTC